MVLLLLQQLSFLTLLVSRYWMRHWLWFRRAVERSCSLQAAKALIEVQANIRCQSLVILPWSCRSSDIFRAALCCHWPMRKEPSGKRQRPARRPPLPPASIARTRIERVLDLSPFEVWAWWTSSAQFFLLRCTTLPFASQRSLRLLIEASLKASSGRTPLPGRMVRLAPEIALLDRRSAEHQVDRCLDLQRYGHECDDQYLPVRHHSRGLTTSLCKRGPLATHWRQGRALIEPLRPWRECTQRHLCGVLRPMWNWTFSWCALRL